MVITTLILLSVGGLAFLGGMSSAGGSISMSNTYPSVHETTYTSQTNKRIIDEINNEHDKYMKNLKKELTRSL